MTRDLERQHLMGHVLAALNQLGSTKHYENCTLGPDTVLSIFLEQVENWHRIPVPSVIAMFAALMPGLPIADLRRMKATADSELQTARECTAQAIADGVAVAS